MSEQSPVEQPRMVMLQHRLDEATRSESHWRLQYKFACRVLLNWIELVDAADGTMVEPTPELIEETRYHAHRSA